MRILPFVALSSILFADVATAALDDETRPVDATVQKAEATVKKALLAPMKTHEQKRSRFSRARMPPADRRVRMLDDTPRTDSVGETYVAFAVDERYGRMATAEWNTDQIVGCAYPSSGDIFVKVGETWRTAAFLLGKKAKSAPSHVCQDDPSHSELASEASANPGV